MSHHRDNAFIFILVHEHSVREAVSYEGLQAELFGDTVPSQGVRLW